MIITKEDMAKYKKAIDEKESGAPIILIENGEDKIEGGED